MCGEKRRLGIAAAFLVAALCWTGIASAGTDFQVGLYWYDYGDVVWDESFWAISNNSGVANALSQQLRIEVGMTDTDTAFFTFSNDGPIDSTITDIYWDHTDPQLLDYLSLLGPSGWTTPANPGILPSGNNLTPDFVVSASTQEGNGVHGIDQGESATFTMDLFSSATIEMLFFDLGINDPGDPHDLRFGLHVQSINGDQSDSFYSPNDPNMPPSPQDDIVVPVPGAAGLGLLGLGLVGVINRRRKMA